jgi:hypothetical protein
VAAAGGGGDAELPESNRRSTSSGKFEPELEVWLADLQPFKLRDWLRGEVERRRALVFPKAL